MNKTIQQFLNESILMNQTLLVNECLKNGLFYYIDVENDTEDENGNLKDIFSWYLVDSFLSVKLREAGEPILSNDFGTWWGRTCFGQLIEDDAVIKGIYEKYFN